MTPAGQPAVGRALAANEASSLLPHGAALTVGLAHAHKSHRSGAKSIERVEPGSGSLMVEAKHLAMRLRSDSLADWKRWVLRRARGSKLADKRDEKCFNNNIRDDNGDDGDGGPRALYFFIVTYVAPLLELNDLDLVTHTSLMRTVSLASSPPSPLR